MSLKDDFERIKECELTDLEIENLIESHTSGYELSKVKLLYEDFDTWLEITKEGYRCSFSDEAIRHRLEEVIKEGRDIPFLKIEPIMGTEFPKNILDVIALMDPLAFWRCHVFANRLKELISSNEIRKRRLPRKSPTLSLKEIALLAFYNGESITRKNSEDKLKDHHQNSGHKLYIEYQKICSNANRRGFPGSQRKLQFKIKSLSRVIALLPQEKRRLATDELKMLESHLRL